MENWLQGAPVQAERQEEATVTVQGSDDSGTHTGGAGWGWGGGRGEHGPDIFRIQFWATASA